MFNDKKFRYGLYYMIIAIIIIIIFNLSFKAIRTKKIDYNEFMKLLNQKSIERVEISRTQIRITPKKSKNGSTAKTLYTANLNDPSIIPKLEKAGIPFSGAVAEEGSMVKSAVTGFIIPIFILFLVWRMFFVKIDKKMGGGVMSFGRNNGKIYGENETGKTFNDVAGQEEAKESLVEIIDFLHNPKKYTEIGAKLPKGALLVGPPGTGKTLLAKAVAGEAKVPFFSISGSEFVEMFVGMGAARVRDLFKQAEQKAPCIIFIDEIDAIGKSRDYEANGNDEREQTLNQLLSEMDGFDSSKGVVILAATNRPEVLDKALLRPGRFDRRVIVDRPDLRGREAILKVHLKDVKTSGEIDLSSIAKATPGAVGADLANIVNESALHAVKYGRNFVNQDDLQYAVELISTGKEKKDRILSGKEKREVAFHEVGHALLAAFLKDADPVKKITIIPTTMGALGYTMQLPQEEKYLVTKDEMMDKIIAMLGGRAAEEVEFSSMSTGAANDIERATQMARSMVTTYGMTDRFDLMSLESTRSKYLDGKEVLNCSNKTAGIIDDETLNIIKSAHKDAIRILGDNKLLLESIAGKLLEKETLTGDEFMNMIESYDGSLINSI